MQHLDEGKIHTWLDGQMDARETAEVGAHVAVCAECATKVAEERGFAAGATRILTALDNVPGDVVPVFAPPANFSQGFLRVAATVLVVATGGLIVVRASGDKVEIPTAAKTVSVPDTPVRTPAEAEGGEALNTAPAVPVTATSGRRSAAPLKPQPSSSVAQRKTSLAPPNAIVVIGSAVPAPAPSPLIEKPRGLDTTEVDLALTKDELQPQAVVTTGVTSVAAPKLNVVRSETVGGRHRTLLRTETGQFAWLTQSASPPSESTPERSAKSAPSRAVADAQSMGSSATPDLRSPSEAGLTITWKNDANKKFYSLSGPFSYAELRQLRIRIENDMVLGK